MSDNKTWVSVNDVANDHTTTEAARHVILSLSKMNVELESKVAELQSKLDEIEKQYEIVGYVNMWNFSDYKIHDTKINSACEPIFIKSGDS